MTAAEHRISGRSGPAFLSLGFRPFFLSAALWAALSMALWILMLRGQPVLPTAFDPVSWHAHEALFGYLGRSVAGFTLTAVPGWTGRPPLAGWTLLGLFILWLLGRVAIAISDYLPPVPVAAIDLCFSSSSGDLLREIVAAKNWRNLAVIALTGAFVAGNAQFHREAAWGVHAASGYGLRIGVAAAIMLISLIGGRIVPAFTRNWLLERGSDRLPAAFGRPDRLALVLSLLALVFWAAMPDESGTGIFLLAAGVTQLLRLSRWRAMSTGTEPLVWILHVGYAFVPIGMLAVGAAILWPDALTGAAAQHLWMAGAIRRHDSRRHDPRDPWPRGRSPDGGRGDDGPVPAGGCLGDCAAVGWRTSAIGAVALDLVRHLVVLRLCGIRASLRTIADWLERPLNRGSDPGGLAGCVANLTRGRGGQAGSRVQFSRTASWSLATTLSPFTAQEEGQAISITRSA